jgi:hypothetical protein
MLAYVRGKYTTTPIPGAEVTLNQSDLLADARDEKAKLLQLQIDEYQKEKNNYKPYAFNPFTTGLNILNTGLNTIGGMRNMSRMRNQENFNSFITQQPEAIYPNKRMLYGDKSMFAEMGGEYSKGGMYPDGGSVYDPDAYVGQLVQYKKGGIYIKPENKGKFTAWAQSHGMSVQEAASHVMANKEKYSSTTVKRANFAKNASKWKKEKGGEVDNDKEMVDGVADILSRVNDVENRKELARYMTNQFNDENVDYDYDKFLAATNLMEMAYGGMYENGGTSLPPIFTSDRNDPRLRNYNDSLSLYNLYRRNLNADRRIPTLNTLNDPTSGPIFTRRYSLTDPVITSSRPLFRGSTENSRRIRPIGALSHSDREIAFDNDYLPIYRRPVQPVQYRKEEPKVFTEIPTPLNPNYTPEENFMITSYRNMINNTLPIVNQPNNNPIKWFALGSGEDGNYDNILMDNKYYTKDEFEKFKAANPNFKYSQKPDSIGRKYSYGGHYIPQDVNYIGGRFIPNRVDLQEFKKGGMIKRADGSYSKKGLWDNIRANKGSGKKPTKEMLKQERKIKKGYKAGGEHMEGNEYEISGEELERLRSLGYDVELI